MNQGYAPILGNFDPTKGQQAAAALPDASATWSSSYPATTAAPAASATSYRYSPRTSTGSRNRYAEIMSQYEQARPYSFTSMPPSYSGGYDVSQPQAYAAPANRYANIMAQGAMGGNSSRSTDFNPEWTGLSDAGKAAFYAENPFFSKATQLGQNIFGYTWPGALQNKTMPDFVARQKLIAQGIDPATMDYSNEGRNYPAPTGGFVSAAPAQSDTSNYSNEGRNYSVPTGGRPYGTGPVPPHISENDFYAAEAAFAQPAETQSLLSRYPAQNSAADAAAAAASAAASAQAAAQGDTSNYSNEGRGGGGGNSGGGGGGVATGGNNGDASGGGDRGTRGGFAQGGHVSMMHLQGPNPEGPDDGYAALKDGEYVINDKAVKKYGIELMNAINSGKISKGKLRGLLEM